MQTKILSIKLMKDILINKSFELNRSRRCCMIRLFVSSFDQKAIKIAEKIHRLHIIDINISEKVANDFIYILYQPDSIAVKKKHMSALSKKLDAELKKSAQDRLFDQYLKTFFEEQYETINYFDLLKILNKIDESKLKQGIDWLINDWRYFQEVRFNRSKIILDFFRSFTNQSDNQMLKRYMYLLKPFIGGYPIKSIEQLTIFRMDQDVIKKVMDTLKIVRKSLMYRLDWLIYFLNTHVLVNGISLKEFEILEKIGSKTLIHFQPPSIQILSSEEIACFRDEVESIWKINSSNKTDKGSCIIDLENLDINSSFNKLRQKYMEKESQVIPKHLTIYYSRKGEGYVTKSPHTDPAWLLSIVSIPKGIEPISSTYYPVYNGIPANGLPYSIDISYVDYPNEGYIIESSYCDHMNKVLSKPIIMTPAQVGEITIHTANTVHQAPVNFLDMHRWFVVVGYEKGLVNKLYKIPKNELELL